jgi:hypothetical protein
MPWVLPFFQKLNPSKNGQPISVPYSLYAIGCAHFFATKSFRFKSPGYLDDSYYRGFFFFGSFFFCEIVDNVNTD